MTYQQSVLIVDSVDETRGVLKTALERKGLEILEARAPDEGLSLLRQRRPNLIVVDLESDDTPHGLASEDLAQETRLRSTPLVMLGSLRRATASPAAGEVVSKPYHYAPLIRKIEQLLGVARQRAAGTR